MSISQERWLDVIEQQVNKYQHDNGGPTANPLLQMDVAGMKTLIGLARRGLGKPTVAEMTVDEYAKEQMRVAIGPAYDVSAPHKEMPLNTIIHSGKTPWAS
jgi:hypothetical protein